ncbi:MAG: hypothetical protein QOJ26_1188 [Thermoplasmata archaeon]|nr:hypothetical protein [Thermoplasmata archaeon]MEA3166316.1 hypothetical protein [Thermoplasmata archaeon]
MAQTYQKGARSTVHRIDLPCDQTGFQCPPPFDVHMKFLPALPPLQGWTLLAHAAAGKPDALARWLAEHPTIKDIRVEPGLSPKLLRATMVKLPPLWESAASFVKVHHLDLTADGHASWFIEATSDQVLAFVNDLETKQDLPLKATEVRVRPVRELMEEAPISRRQFEALATAVQMGYYDIPHRLDLRTLAKQSGISLGSLSELLRRAEAAILTHYVDTSLMAWPPSKEEPPNPFRPIENLVQLAAWRRVRESQPPSRAGPAHETAHAQDGAQPGWPLVPRA